MWHFSVVRLFVKACRGGRKGGSFLQLYNITGICAFILCEVHYSTLFSVSTHTGRGNPPRCFEARKKSHLDNKISGSVFCETAREEDSRYFFVCASNVYWFTFDKYWMDTCVTLLLFLACWTLVNNKCHFSIEVEKRELKYHHIESAVYFSRAKTTKQKVSSVRWKKHLFDNSILVLKP